MDEKLPEWLKENADGSLAITLRRGAKVDGANLKTLTMREPTVKDHLGASASGDMAAREATLFANLCMITPEAVHDITLRDYRRLQVAFEFFTEE